MRPQRRPCNPTGIARNRDQGAPSSCPMAVSCPGAAGSATARNPPARRAVRAGQQDDLRGWVRGLSARQRVPNWHPERLEETPAVFACACDAPIRCAAPCQRAQEAVQSVAARCRACRLQTPTRGSRPKGLHAHAPGGGMATTIPRRNAYPPSAGAGSKHRSIGSSPRSKAARTSAARALPWITRPGFVRPHPLDRRRSALGRNPEACPPFDLAALCPSVTGLPIPACVAARLVSPASRTTRRTECHRAERMNVDDLPSGGHRRGFGRSLLR